jgi:hypothetical protein
MSNVVPFPQLANIQSSTDPRRPAAIPVADLATAIAPLAAAVRSLHGCLADLDRIAAAIDDPLARKQTMVLSDLYREALMGALIEISGDLRRLKPLRNELIKAAGHDSDLVPAEQRSTSARDDSE